jgi:hypothetical protein
MNPPTCNKTLLPNNDWTRELQSLPRREPLLVKATVEWGGAARWLCQIKAVEWVSAINKKNL